MNHSGKLLWISARKLIMRIICFKQIIFSKKILALLEDNTLDINKVNSFTDKYLKSIFLSAKTYSDYYKNIDDENLNSVQVVNKDILRENMSSFINPRFPFYNKFQFNTGGSTGEPFVFYTDRLSGYVDASHQRFLHRKIGYKEGDRVFSIDGAVIPEELQKQHIYWIKSGYPDDVFGSYCYSALCLTEESLPYILASFENRKPAILRGYPSAITEIAEFIVKTGYNIRFQLKGIVLTAENIMEKQIALINKAFKAPIYGQYGHSEKCIFAYTEANSLVYTCSPYYGFVEILDGNDKHVEIGETGRIVVTGYYNEAMYFLRYDTGDLATYGGRDCKGAVILAKIIGRQQDFIFDTQRNRINITALIFGQHFHAFGHIKKWQIVQHELGKIEIRIVKSVHYCEQDESEIRNKFLIMNFGVKFTYVDSIALTPRGKHRLVDQKLAIV